MFQCEYKVGIGDINYGGHMGNERALLLFQQARIEFFQSLGYSELNIGEGCGIIQKEAKVSYKKEVFFNENLEIKVIEVEFKRSSFNMIFEVLDESDDIVFSGETLLISYDYDLKKIKSVPKDFKGAVSKIK